MVKGNKTQFLTVEQNMHITIFSKSVDFSCASITTENLVMPIPPVVVCDVCLGPPGSVIFSGSLQQNSILAHSMVEKIIWEYAV